MAYVDRAVLAYRAQTREIGSRPAQGSQEVSSPADDETPGESPVP
jgi:hypothetical protein